MAFSMMPLIVSIVFSLLVFKPLLNARQAVFCLLAQKLHSGDAEQKQLSGLKQLSHNQCV